MKLITRSLLLISLVFAARVIHSCGCPDNPHFFDFDLITIANLDNSRDYVRSNPTDTMYTASVAFEISISGSRGYAQNEMSKVNFGFSEAKAMEPCPIRFVPNQQITNITITTLEAISSEFPENSDVTDLFLGLIPYNSSSEYMYESIDNLYNKINRDNSFNEPTATLQLFFKADIQNTQARFELTVDLTDGRTLTAITNPIHLKPSYWNGTK